MGWMLPVGDTGGNAEGPKELQGPVLRVLVAEPDEARDRNQTDVVLFNLLDRFRQFHLFEHSKSCHGRMQGAWSCALVVERQMGNKVSHFSI